MYNLQQNQRQMVEEHIIEDRIISPITLRNQPSKEYSSVFILKKNISFSIFYFLIIRKKNIRFEGINYLPLFLVQRTKKKFEEIRPPPHLILNLI